jgi:hypothetical protein
MATDFLYSDMTEEQMKQWAEENPTRLNDLDRIGSGPLLCVGAYRDFTRLVEWLVDEKGASIHRTAYGGVTPLHWSSSPEVIPLLLARGADVTALSDQGWTPLMVMASRKKSSCVELLLKEPKVIETIDTQATAGFVFVGCTALHLACQPGRISVMERKQLLEMLICAGANPTIMNQDRETPLDVLRHDDDDNDAAIALLERAQCIALLAKPRAINDANHAVAKAKEDAQRKVLASAPTCLQGRVREQQQQQQQQQQLPRLPHVEIHPPVARRSGGLKRAKKRHAVLQYVLHAEELGETGGLKAELFVDLMDMMAPRWDPIRLGHGGGGGGGQGQGQGQG